MCRAETSLEEPIDFEVRHGDVANFRGRILMAELRTPDASSYVPPLFTRL